METRKRIDALLDAGLTAEALHNLGPAMIKAVRALADIEHDLLNRSSLATALIEERIVMNRNLRHLLKHAAVVVQNALDEINRGVEPASPSLIILHPDRHAAHHAIGLAAFVDQCSKLVAAVDAYVGIHIQTGLDAVGNTVKEAQAALH